MVDHTLRARISAAVTEALQPLPEVFAGWEGGSAAFGAVDAYSDIDLEFVVADDASFEDLYTSVERAIEAVSPITASYSPLQGRYYKLKEGGDFFLVDLIFHRAGDPDDHLVIERHGEKVTLFDKGNWLRPRPVDEGALATQREARCRELQTWFPMSQVFVRKAILRGQHVEAVNAFWACTLKPLAELLRMRYCPVRWDFGVRYLDRDLPPAVYEQVRNLALVQDLEDLQEKWTKATAWGTELLREWIQLELPNIRLQPRGGWVSNWPAASASGAASWYGARNAGGGKIGRMPELTVRERILQALEDLPPDATFEEAIERLVFLAKIDAGLAELDAGEGIPHDEAKRRLGM